MEARLQDKNALNNVVEEDLAELPFRQWLKREQRAKAQLMTGAPPIGEKSMPGLRLQLLLRVAFEAVKPSNTYEAK